MNRTTFMIVYKRAVRWPALAEDAAAAGGLPFHMPHGPRDPEKRRPGTERDDRPNQGGSLAVSAIAPHSP